ncbi:hypothetical protein [Acetohalobium arabaticum]|uniref:hypothetical protein n=1 Tax=Acetohalobium arabaticum TaxID=28187 RepID=UPI00031F2F02|nr:hypothetical protein [Acetohalobium arabaticum]
MNDNLAIYQPESNRVFTSPSSIADFKANLEDEIKAQEEELREYQDREGFFIELNQELKRFYRYYQAEEIEDWRVAKEELTARRADLKNQLQKTKQEQQKLKEVKEDKETKRQTLQEKIVKLEQEQQRLDDFMDNYQLQNSKESELNKVKQKEHQQEYLDYGLEEIKAASKVESSYSEVKSQVDELESGFYNLAEE